MKKLLVSCVLCAFAASFVAAQTFGVKGNFNMNLGSSFSDEMKDGFKELEESGVNVSYPMIVGGGAGVYFRYNLPSIPSLGFQGELGLAFNNGVSAKIGSSESYMKVSVSYTSLEIPVLLTYDIGISDSIKLRLLAGPNFSIPLGKAKSTVEYNYGGTSNKEDYEGDISHFAFGIAAGVAGSFDVGPGAIIAELRYTNDFSKIQSIEEAEGETYKQDAMIRRNLSISAGYESKF